MDRLFPWNPVWQKNKLKWTARYQQDFFACKFAHLLLGISRTLPLHTLPYSCLTYRALFPTGSMLRRSSQLSAAGHPIKNRSSQLINNLSSPINSCGEGGHSFCCCGSLASCDERLSHLSRGYRPPPPLVIHRDGGPGRVDRGHYEEDEEDETHPNQA